MQNHRTKKDKLPKVTKSDIPSHFSSKSQGKKLQKYDSSDRKKVPPSVAFIKNITCQARNAFYMQQDHNINNTPWMTSRVTSTMDNGNECPLHRCPKPIKENRKTAPMKKPLTRYSKLKLSTLSTPLISKNEAWERYHKIGKPEIKKTTKKQMTVINNLQHSTLSTPLFKKPESRERVYKVNKPEKVNATKNQTKRCQSNLQNSAEREYSFRPKRLNTMPVVPKYNDIFCDVPHLKYGLFGNQRKISVQNRMRTKSPPILPPQNVRNDRKHSVNTGPRTRVSPKFVYRLVEKHLQRQLTMSEMMHIDIRPNPVVRRNKSPVSRHNGYASSRNIPPYSGRISPLFRSFSPQMMNPKKGTQSIRNIVPFRNISLPFKMNAPKFRCYVPNFSLLGSVTPLDRSTISRQI